MVGRVVRIGTGVGYAGEAITARRDKPVEHFLGHAVPVEVGQAAAARAADAGPVLAVERIAEVPRLTRILLLILAADVAVEALLVEVPITPGDRQSVV